MTPPTPPRQRPTDDAIVIAALACGRSGFGPDPGWLYADEIRGQLALFGFKVHTQQVSAWLGRLAREDSPMFERRNNLGHDLEYRVTRFGKTQIRNHFPGLRLWD